MLLRRRLDAGELLPVVLLRQGHPAGEIAPGAVAGGQHVGCFLQAGLTGDRVALGQKSGQLRQIKL